MLIFDARVKNSDAAQPRVTNVKTPILAPHARGPFDATPRGVLGAVLTTPSLVHRCRSHGRALRLKRSRPT